MRACCPSSTLLFSIVTSGVRSTDFGEAPLSSLHAAERTDFGQPYTSVPPVFTLRSYWLWMGHPLRYSYMHMQATITTADGPMRLCRRMRAQSCSKKDPTIANDRCRWRLERVADQIDLQQEDCQTELPEMYGVVVDRGELPRRCRLGEVGRPVYRNHTYSISEIIAQCAYIVDI